MFNQIIFSERIRKLRSATSMSQEELGQKIGVGKSTISMIEKGQRAASIEVLYALADYFDVSLDYLVGRSDDPTRR